MQRVLLDLFCGHWGWSRAFAKRGWKCYGIDLVRPSDSPEGCVFLQWDILFLNGLQDYKADAIVASPPCERFSVHGMKHFHPNPPYPELGIKLFNHTRQLCEASGLPYVIENVRAAQQFVGQAVHHCGPFYLWGNAVPPMLHKGVTKGSMIWSPRYRNMKKAQRKQEVSQIPGELANCVADYFERLLEQRESECKVSAQA